MQLYGSTIPPIYDAGRITCPYIALFSAVSDVLADVRDVEYLRETLPVRPLYDEIIRDPGFGHSTVTYGDPETVIKFVIRPVLSVLTSLK